MTLLPLMFECISHGSGVFDVERAEFGPRPAQKTTKEENP